MQKGDHETRERLLAVATRLFAENGYTKVTVRAICQKARANVAAVNYHFKGKEGLYRAVLSSAVVLMQSTTEAARKAGAAKAPDEQLSIYIAVFLNRVMEGRNSWVHQLMKHELADPTPALDMVVEEVIRPRTAYLAGIIAAIMECAPDDPRVRRSLFSVHSQCLAMMNAPSVCFLLDATISPALIDAMARHIARFSIAGIRADY